MTSLSASEKLDTVTDEFADLEPRERLELLLDFSEGLPELPPRYKAERDAGINRVHECQTPVFLWVEVEHGLVQIFGDVAPEAPTVKGFVGILVEAFSGVTPESVLAVEPNVVQRLGLLESLGMVRMRGLHAILHHVREKVRRAAAAQSPS